MNNKTPYSLPGHGSTLITRKENGTATPFMTILSVKTD